MKEHDSLAIVLSEFARTLVTDFPIEGILDHLVHRIVDILPVDAAGVSLISPVAAPHAVAGSDESAVRYELLQTTLGEGPCVAAYETDVPISIADLRHDERFPTFAKDALAEGLMAVFTFPLRNDDRCLGALDLYRRTPGELDEEDMATAQTLADVATAYLLNAEARSSRADFVATVSHELRTPMTSIQGFVELLEEEATGPLTPRQAGFVAAIARNSERLTHLADDLLTLSAFEEGGTRHPHVELDLQDVMAAARRTIAPIVDARGVAVSCDAPEGPVLMRGSAADLEALVVNLLSNALKFTGDGGWVVCRLTSTSIGARIEVSDNGLGIPLKEQRDLFTRFFRSTTARQHAIQGTGLGLTIVDSIARNHGGSVSVVSGHLQGSVFTVDLPRGGAPVTALQ